MKRRRLCFNGRAVELVEEDLPPPAPGELAVRTEWTQVSIGTEVAHIEENAKRGAPAGLGYCNVGVVEEAGAGVAAFRPGQRVLTIATHASRVNVPATPERTVGVPDGLAPDTAVLAILGAVAYHIVERAAPRLLEPTAVVGQGVVGSLILQLARHCGAEPLIAVDADPARLAEARALGATHTLDASREDVVARVKELTGGQGVTLAIEAATSVPACQAALGFLALRGRLVLTSTLFEPLPVRVLQDFIERELTLLGAHQPKCPNDPNPYYLWTQAGNRTAALSALHAGRLKAGHLISHRASPEEAPALYERLRRKDRSIRGLLLDWRNA